MHSRKKVPRDEAKENERLQKASKFSSALTKILQMKKTGCKDRNLLGGISDLLFVSPDFFTLWNYRREIFIAFKEEVYKQTIESSDNQSSSADASLKIDEFDKLCKNELSFIENCLKVNPKSYGTWHHRYWLIAFMNEPNLKREIQLCNQFLQMDERNFHCWNYRRYIVKLANIGPEEELEFSSEKINENFSNFSSWYYRSSLLKILYASGHDCESIQSNLDQDYCRVQEALYTDPTDQSVWLYLKWLFSVYAHGLESLSGAKCVKSSSLEVKRFLWTSSISNDYYFAIELSNFVDRQPDIVLRINGNTVELKNWTSANGFVWYTQVEFDGSFKNNKQYIFELQSNSSSLLELPPTVTFILSRNNESENCLSFIYQVKPNNQSIAKIEPEKYQSLKDLLELEPDNKWLNFTLASLEFDEDHLNEIIDKLIQIDKLRTNFYKDLRSKIIMNKFTSSGDSTNLSLSLTNLKLHSLSGTNQLSHICYLDLSHNDLIKLGKTFSPLISLRCLILDYNSIYLVDDKLILPNLTILSMANNRINKGQMIDVILSNFTKLKHLVLFDNPILQNQTERKSLEDKVANLKIYFDKTETGISMVIKMAFESTRKMYANEVMKTE